ncbi:unnamed protein product [Dicrocoelium dendriticum]|nr:unnamed protein product [Dicrocoelium dendriticum]
MSTESEVHCLLSEARILFERGQYHESLHCCQKAYNIKASPSILRKIGRIRAFTLSSDENHCPSSQSPPSSPVKEVAKHLAIKARHALDCGNLKDALRFLKESHECVPSAKIAAKIKNLEEAISNDIQLPSCSSEQNSASSDLNVDEMILDARACYEDGDFTECLRLLQKVQEIAPSDKIERKIDRIKKHLRSENIEPVIPKKTDVVAVATGFHLPRSLYDKLYPYQRDGVRWLWRLHNTGPGGVLADDMGLGKTLQVIAFLSGLFLANQRRLSILVIMPVSVLMTWESELKRWAPSLRVALFHDAGKSTRLHQLSSIQKHGGILLTTYGMVTSSAVDLSTDINAEPQFLRAVPKQSERRQGSEFVWDYMILDEAHKIKNPAAKTTKGVLSISAQHRILLTGTAVQNSLRELWALYNCTHSGRLLGRLITFKTEYERPITRAREKDASRAERAHGHLMAQSLRKLIDPYFLRRTKDEVLPSITAHSLPDGHMDNVPTQTADIEAMPKKHELVIWLYLRHIQERSYRDFLELDQVKALLLRQDRRSPLMELLILKKLCDHPRLLSVEQCASFNLEATHSSGQAYSKVHLPSAAQLCDESGKLMFLRSLMSTFLDEKLSNSENPPRTLIFSQSLRFLDMAEKVILAINDQPEHVSRSLKHRILRLDGRLAKVDERLQVIRLFERDTSYTVMLLTTQVGGVGLTLTAANRVILLDPSWNPATDAQAVDRAYRIGQKSNVIVYRLITCGTVEEKIYRRQVFKDSVVRQTTGTGRNKSDNDPYRYFTHQDLRELFTLGDSRVSKTQQQLAALHPDTDKWSDEVLRPHLTLLTGGTFQDTVFGLSFHDLMFTRVEPIEQSNELASNDHELYQNRMRAAEYAIAQECAIATGPLTRDLANIHVHDERIFRLPTFAAISIPSHADSKRPMLNRLPLGPGAQYPSPPKHINSPVLISDTEDLVDNQLAASLREISISQQHTSDNFDPDDPVKSGNTGNGGTRGNSASSEVLSGSVTDAKSADSFICESANNAVHLFPECQLISETSKSGNVLQSGSSDSIRVRSTPSSGTCDKSFSTSFMVQLPGSTPVNARFLRQPMPAHTPLSKFSKHTPSPLTHDDQCPGFVKSVVSTSQTPTSSDDEEEDEPILMDITTPMDDVDFGHTVHMKSLHEILVRSGIFQQHSEEQFEQSSQSSAIVIEDSDLGVTSDQLADADTNVVDETAEMVEDRLSFTEQQSRFQGVS